MALELAVAFVRVKVDRSRTSKEISETKKFIRRKMGGTRMSFIVRPKIDKRAFNVLLKRIDQIRASALNATAAVRNLGIVSQKVNMTPKGNAGPSFQGTGRTRLPLPSALQGGGGRGVGGGGGFGAGPSGLPTGVGGAVNTMSGASRVRAGSQAFSGQLKSFAKTSGQIAVGILGAQAALGTIMFPIKAIQDTMTFESAMVRVKAVTQATESEFKNLSDAAMELGLNTIFTANEVAEAMVNLGQKGLSAIETINATPIILNFAAAGGISPEEASDTLVGIMRSVGASIDQMTEISDIFARASVKTSLDIKKIGDSFRYIGPLADMAGLKLSEVSAAVGMLVSRNITPSMAGTGIRNIVTDILDPGVVSKMEKLLGVSLQFRKANGQLKDFADIIDMINNAFGENAPDADKASFSRQVFGKRGGPAFAALLKGGADELRQLTGVIGEGDLTAAELAMKKMETMEGATKRLIAALEFLSIKVVMPMSAAFQAVGNGIADVIVKMVKLEGTVPKMIALTTGMMGLGFATIFAGKAFLFLGKTALTLLFSKFGAFALALTGIAALFVQVTGEGETFGEKINNVFENIVDTASFAFRNMGLLFERGVLSMYDSLFENVPIMKEAFESWGIFVIAIVDGVVAAWDAMLNYLKGTWDELKNLFEAVMAGIKEGSIDKAIEVLANQEDVEVANPFEAFTNAFSNTRDAGLEGFADKGLEVSVKERLAKIDQEIAQNEMNRNIAKANAAGQLGGARGGSLGSRQSVEPRFVGVKELSKQIQLGVLKTQEQQIQKKIEKNTADGVKLLKQIAEGSGGGVFQ